jgi:hypothetical protein
MSKKTFFLFILLFTLTKLCVAQAPVSYGSEYNGYKLATDSLQNCVLVNQYGVILSVVDSSTINTNEIIQEIKNSSIKDKLLIVRVLETYPDNAKRTDELLNMTNTYGEIDLMVLKQMEIHLQNKFSKRQLKKLKKKKK